MTANYLLMQFLADVLDVPVERPMVTETVSPGRRLRRRAGRRLLGGPGDAAQELAPRRPVGAAHGGGPARAGDPAVGPGGGAGLRLVALLSGRCSIWSRTTGERHRALRVRDRRRPSNLIRLAPAKEVESRPLARSPPRTSGRCTMTTAARARRRCCPWPCWPACSVGGGAADESDGSAEQDRRRRQPRLLGDAQGACWRGSRSRPATRVEVQPNGDAGQLTNKLVLTKGSPIADVAYGIDNTFASRAVDEGVLVDHTPKDAAGLGVVVRPGRPGRGRPADPGRLRRRVRQRRRRVVPQARHDPAADPRRPHEPAYKGLFVTPGATAPRRAWPSCSPRSRRTATTGRRTGSG